MTRSFERFVKRLDEIGLHDEIRTRALARAVSLRDLYSGPRVPSTMRARRAVYTWLTTRKRKSINEVARMFDRAPTGVRKLVEEAS
jgi:hypothetical protein